MASSNVQLQQIAQQFSALGVSNPQQYLTTQKQISILNTRLSSIDQNNLPLYSSTLESLYRLQTSLPPAANVAAVNALLAQKVQVLQALTNPST